MTTSLALFGIVVLKALIEIAAFSLLAQAIVGALAGPARQKNVVYGLLQTVTQPVLRVARKLTPGRIADHYLGLVAFLLLCGFWLLLLYAKVHVCHTQNLACFAAP